MKYNRKFPFIDDQKINGVEQNNCTLAALAGICNFFIAQKGNTDFCDAGKFYLELFPKADGKATINQALIKAKTTGIPTKGGNRVFVKDSQRFTFISPGVITAALDSAPVIFTMLLPNGLNFEESLDANGTYHIPMYSHTMAFLDYDPVQKLVLGVNSQGTKFGKAGYFTMQLMDISVRSIVEAFSFTI